MTAKKSKLTAKKKSKKSLIKKPKRVNHKKCDDYFVERLQNFLKIVMYIGIIKNPSNEETEKLKSNFHERFDVEVLAGILMNKSIGEPEDKLLWDAIEQFSDMKTKKTWRPIVPDLNAFFEENKNMEKIDLEDLMS